MNPLKWKREQQVALLLFMIAGVPLGVAYGYLAYATGIGAQSSPYQFSEWLFPWWGHYSHLGWAAAGASISGILAYASKLLRS